MCVFPCDYQQSPTFKIPEKRNELHYYATINLEWEKSRFVDKDRSLAWMKVVLSDKLGDKIAFQWWCDYFIMLFVIQVIRRGTNNNKYTFERFYDLSKAKVVAIKLFWCTQEYTGESSTK